MRILLHDFPGHAFPTQLSRGLARRGHEVLHLFFDQFEAPKGPLSRRPEDPAGLSFEAVTLDEPFAKYSFAKRFFQERAYATRLVRRTEAFRPDVVLGGNAPLDPQARLLDWSNRNKVGFLFWLQDVYGVAIHSILKQKLGLAGALVGRRYMGLERRLWRRSDRIVAITEDFRPILEEHGVARERVDVIENWAVLDETPVRPRDNDWSREHGLTGCRTLLYSGTLGLKHNPELLASMAEAFKGEGDVRIVVVSEGVGRNYLEAEKVKRGLSNLTLLPFQPYERVPDLLASGDVLVVLLEPDAGIYSVPSKTLAYLCAGRPILGGIPLENLAARLLTREGAGRVAAPEDVTGFIANARSLLNDPSARILAGQAGRAYAERSFDIEAIAAKFEAALEATRARRS